MVSLGLGRLEDDLSRKGGEDQCYSDLITNHSTAIWLLKLEALGLRPVSEVAGSQSCHPTILPASGPASGTPFDREPTQAPDRGDGQASLVCGTVPDSYAFAIETLLHVDDLRTGRGRLSARAKKCEAANSPPPWDGMC